MKQAVSCMFLYAVLVVSALAQSTTSGQFAEPQDAELDRFPIMSRPLTIAEQAKFGLTAKEVVIPVVVQNHFRNLRDKRGRFVLETLPTGTILLVDRDNKIRYRADCGNRLVELAKCPVCPAIASGNTQSDLTVRRGIGSNASPRPGLWKRFTEGMKSAATGLWNFISNLVAPFGWLLLLLFGLAFLALIAYGIYRFIRWIVDGIRGRGQGGQAPVPIVPPAAPAPAVPPPPPGPRPVPPVAGPAGFDPDGLLFNAAGADGPSMVQIGRNVGRVQVNPGADDSVTIRVFRRRN